jgi:hypothetical protein
MKRTLFASVICTAMLLALPACDGNGSGGGDEIPGTTATFQATIDGATERSINGTAFSGGPGGGGGWVLVMGVVVTKTDGTSADASMSIGRAVGDRPGEGTFSVIADPEQQSTDFYAVAVITEGIFTGTSGNFVVESSSSSNVRGTFDFNATNGTETVRITGGFNATNAFTGLGKVDAARD